ncbi:hypothetical protein J7E63_12890 [Bacillus sp. ISL-75]|uniref:phage tail protein n=1 Tax=Bacillus sp. ISL-75 TaxID=2819137 RepID=UPI001BE7B347|nr:hypothetical protein [Bacillus sp. ISL-75]MBT2727835.1 hypothetical protein [Bacillus sp. ISL-75]
MATMAEMMIEIGIDPSELDRGARQAQNDMRSIGTSAATLADNMDTSMADIRRQWRGMSEEMRQAHRQNAAALAPFRAEQQQIQYEFFRMAQGMGEYQGSTEEFMAQLTEMGNRNRTVNNNMMASNNMARMGFIQGIATMLAASTQSSRISANFDRMRNPLYRVNNGLLTVSGGLERMAARGQPAVLALRMLGPTASMQALNNMTMMITAGLMRMNMVALFGAASSAILFSKLASSAYEAVPSFKQAADQMKASLGKAFEPMVQAFAAVVTPIMKVITAIANMAIKFNEAHPFLAKLIQGFLMIIPLLILILSPLAIGIGLFAGLQAAFASVWMLIAPLVTGLAAMSGTVLIVAAVIVALVAVGILLYKNWDTIKAKAIAIWGAIKTFFVNLWSSIMTGVQTAWSSIKEFIVRWWDEILAFITGPIGMLVYLIAHNWETIKATTMNVWNSIKGFFASLWEGIKNIFFTVIEFIVTFIQSKFGFIITGFQTIFTNVVSIIKNYWNIIKNIFMGAILIITDIITGDFGNIKSHIGQIMGNIRGSIASIWNSIKTIFTTYVGMIQQVVSNGFNKVKNGAITTVNALKNGVINGWNALKSGVLSAVNALKNGVVNGFNGAANLAKSVVNGLKTGIPAAWQAIKNGAVNAVIGLKNSVSTWFNSMKSSVSTTMTNTKTAISNGWAQAKGFLSSINLESIGKNIIQGLISGIKSMAGAVGQAIKNVAEGIKGKIKGALGIHSPSRWMRDMIGKNISLGMAVGIEAESGSVMDSLNALTADTQKIATLGIESPELPSLSNQFINQKKVTDTGYGDSRRGDVNVNVYPKEASIDETKVLRAFQRAVILHG